VRAFAVFGRMLARGIGVTLVLIVHGLVWFVGWLALLLTLRPKATRQRWFASRLVRLMIWLGATFVKVGQIMSTRPDLFPPHLIAALTRLQDDVGKFGLHYVQHAVKADFGAPLQKLFARFDPIPVASASVAQVHRAQLFDGREVAVKVRRPRLPDVVRFDLAAMVVIAWIMERIPSIALLAPVDSVREFGRAIRAQIDFTIEAANNRRFRAAFAGDLDVRFPDLVPELCSSRVLTMEWIDGVKVLDAPAKLGADPARLARIGFRTLLQMCFADGFVHADLHPGNILVDASHTVYLIDLGLVAELDDYHRRGFARFFAAWAAADGDTMAALTRELSPSPRIRDYAAFAADMRAFAERYKNKSLGEVDGAKVAFDALGVMRRHRVRVNPGLTVCNIAIAVTEGIGKQLDPGIDLMKEAMPFFAQLAARDRPPAA
jgi:ubiquinone biosynthesis protein